MDLQGVSLDDYISGSNFSGYRQMSNEELYSKLEALWDINKVLLRTLQNLTTKLALFFSLDAARIHSQPGRLEPNPQGSALRVDL